MSNFTYSSRHTVVASTRTFLQELIAATPLGIFIAALKGALQQRVNR
jgi:hypothetical protein